MHSRDDEFLPVTGAWLEGDVVGQRQFVTLGPIDLELGGHLPEVTVAFETWGTLDADGSNGVLVLHALTGDSHVNGPAGAGHKTAGWLDGLVGVDGPINPDQWFVVSSNVLGGCQGTTGPSSIAPDGKPWGSRFPRVTVNDQVRIEKRLAEHLGVKHWASVIGGSMGAMRALEWVVEYPEEVGSAVIVAVGAAATADQIGTQITQIHAITSDPAWNGGDYYDQARGPVSGMGVARRIAHLTYRSESELALRFSNEPQDNEDALGQGRYAVQSYLDHQADKLARRFDAGTYVSLTDVMTTWDLGRGRGGVNHVLAGINTPVIIAGIDTDRLYPLYLQQQLADEIPSTVGGLRLIASPFGHDAFLIEREQVFALVAEALQLGVQASR